MSKRKDRNGAVLDYWNSRADLGIRAGSNDYTAKRLEIEAIASFVMDGQTILDIGCGNGVTTIELARRYEVKIIGLDYAEAMISAARENANNQVLKGEIRFEIGDVLQLPEFEEKFDIVYTERTLINLSDFSLQRRSIKAITDVLKVGGSYVMCENSQDGLNSINRLRERVGLSRIDPPWHNRYFKDDELKRLRIRGVRLERIECYSSTYYLLSRVVNAWCARQEGREPDYNDAINQLAIELPAIGDMGQGKIWLWRKVK